ncbi:hypothetical protein CN227_32930 [Sinorhizobium meliloti]|nr:hypothetical protein [Sinorhizobium meliloti]RVE76903.1 hypothetical protein CN240_32905 [Sinorhizobium meliloti]RVG39420.1 hypothetical protein CN227_32930 [Sinorhizobium meliloti]
MKSSALEHRPAAKMVWVPGATFLMGSNDHYPEEAPRTSLTTVLEIALDVKGHVLFGGCSAAVDLTRTLAPI